MLSSLRIWHLTAHMRMQVAGLHRASPSAALYKVEAYLFINSDFILHDARGFVKRYTV